MDSRRLESSLAAIIRTANADAASLNSSECVIHTAVKTLRASVANWIAITRPCAVRPGLVCSTGSYSPLGLSTIDHDNPSVQQPYLRPSCPELCQHECQRVQLAEQAFVDEVCRRRRKSVVMGGVINRCVQRRSMIAFNSSTSLLSSPSSLLNVLNTDVNRRI